MNFNDVCKRLGIEDYSEAIFNSNSRGGLSHLMDYNKWADIIPDDNSSFRKCFLWALDWSNKNSKNPSAMFQHIDSAIFFAAGKLGVKQSLLIDDGKLTAYRRKIDEFMQ